MALWKSGMWQVRCYSADVNFSIIDSYEFSAVVVNGFLR